MNIKIFSFANFALLLCLGSGLQAQTKITVDAGKPGHSISPTLFGVFFEDINLSADGGIYPETVRNRSFEDADSLQNWKFMSNDGESNASVADADVLARQHKVSPKNEGVKFRGNKMTRLFPANSLTGLRLKTSVETKNNDLNNKT